MMTSRRCILSIILSLALCSCAGAKKRFQADVESGHCDEAVLHLPEKDPLVKLAGQSKQAAGTVLSYTFVGASYTAEVLWDVVGGTVMVAGLCGPMFAASLAANSGGSQQLICLPGRLDALKAPPLGRHANEQTRQMRCPDLKSLSRSMRAVASCFQTRGGDENLSKARLELEAIKNSEEFYDCLPADEKGAVDQQLSQMS